MENTEARGGALQPEDSSILVGGRFEFQLIRGHEIVDQWVDENIVVNEGLNHLLDVLLHGSTQVTPWYIGLFEGNYTPVPTVTAGTIVAAATETTAYAESTRQEYVEAASSGQSTTNSANKATFTFTADKTIYGAFLISNATKQGTTGILLSAARFGAAKTVSNGDQLLVTYTFGAASS